MPRKIRHHLPATESQSYGIKPRYMSKQEFAKRLYNLMSAKGWHQSELARQSGLTRDAISTYIRGRTLPTPQSLEALAGALGVLSEELLANHTEAAIAEDVPAFEMKVSTNAHDMAWLRVNRLVKTSTAVKIAELLQNDDVLHGSGSGENAAVQHVQGKTTETIGEDGLFGRQARAGRGK